VCELRKLQECTQVNWTDRGGRSIRHCRQSCVWRMWGVVWKMDLENE